MTRLNRDEQHFILELLQRNLLSISTDYRYENIDNLLKKWKDLVYESDNSDYNTLIILEGRRRIGARFKILCTNIESGETELIAEGIPYEQAEKMAKETNEMYNGTDCYNYQITIEEDEEEDS